MAISELDDWNHDYAIEFIVAEVDVQQKVSVNVMTDVTLSAFVAKPFQPKRSNRSCAPQRAEIFQQVSAQKACGSALSQTACLASGTCASSMSASDLTYYSQVHRGGSKRNATGTMWA